MPDDKHPDWKQLTPDDRNRIIEYLRQEDLLGEEFFILWLPLRSNAISDRYILPNYYDHQSIQAHLPDNLGNKIATLMPMLRSLQSVHYWLPDENNCLIEKFQVRLDSSAKRCNYPRLDGEIGEPINRSLSGHINLDDYEVAYGGKEILLDAAEFNQLKDSKYWPKRFTQDEFGRPKSVKDKAIPHCGVVFSRSPSEEVGSLTLQWAVFLPLMDESGGAEIEQILSRERWNYTLLLHGYFFLDSGRRSIEALADIYSSPITQPNAPASDTEMMRLWNTILATKGTLPQILPALHELCEHGQISLEEIEELCCLLQQTQIFQNKSLQKFIYQNYYWVYRLQSDRADWQLIDRTSEILALPSIPDWDAFPFLREIAETKWIVLASASNLVPTEAVNSWQDSDIVEILNSLNPYQVFHQVHQFEFLIRWLQSTLRNSQESLSELVQVCLQAQIKTFLAQLETEIEVPRRVWLEAISLLDENRWLQLDSDDLELTQSLNQSAVSILILPPHLAPGRRTCLQLTAEDAAVLIERHHFSLNELFIKQIASAVISEEVETFHTRLSEVQFISGFDCQTNQQSLYSPKVIQHLSQQKQLFLNSDSSRDFALDLQRALYDRSIVLIDALFARICCHKVVQECDREACLMILSQRPKLADCDARINLLKRLLP